MAKDKTPFIVPKRHKNRTLEESFHNISGQDEIVKLIDFEKLIPNDNPYPLSDLEDLIESIKLYGVEQSLLVKKQDQDKYLIIGGHRRYYAVKSILENDKAEEFDYLTQLYCKVMKDDTEDIVVRLRLHESNLQTRPLLKMEEEEKLAIVEEYLDLIQQARDKGIKINGQEVKGKTRDILAKAFNIAPSTAQEIVKKINQKEKGTEIGTPLKTSLSNLEKTEKTISKLAKEIEKLTADELEEMLLSENLKDEKGIIFNALFQSKMKI